jgi:hypothetical protein
MISVITADFGVGVFLHELPLALRERARRPLLELALRLLDGPDLKSRTLCNRRAGGKRPEACDSCAIKGLLRPALIRSWCL